MISTFILCIKWMAVIPTKIYIHSFKNLKWFKTFTGSVLSRDWTSFSLLLKSWFCWPINQNFIRILTMIYKIVCNMILCVHANHKQMVHSICTTIFCIVFMLVKTLMQTNILLKIFKLNTNRKCISNLTHEIH